MIPLKFTNHCNPLCEIYPPIVKYCLEWGVELIVDFNKIITNGVDKETENAFHEKKQQKISFIHYFVLLKSKISLHFYFLNLNIAFFIKYCFIPL